MPTGEILVTPSGMMYEKMVEDDMIVMDIDGNVIEGTRKPSSDTPAILHIFRERPDINAVIHTHQPYATAVSLIPGLTEFRVCITALANAAGGNVPITPYSAAGSIDMGIDTVKYVGNGHAVILSQHGVMTVGKDLNQALYAAVYLEEAAKCYLAARAACVNGEIKHVLLQGDRRCACVQPLPRQTWRWTLRRCATRTRSPQPWSWAEPLRR